MPDAPVRAQSAQTINLTIDRHKVTVPAGTFESWKVELTSGDGGSDKSIVWIAKDTRQPVKISSVMASMGGAVLTAELL